jgi:hopanoid C-3 methylase HpnR
MYTKLYLRLEPIGLELVAQALRKAGHELHLVDLQVENRSVLDKILREWQPEVVAFSCNYLANVPEIIDLAKEIKLRMPGCFIFVGGHSASFTAEDLLSYGEGAIDCVLKGEGEKAAVQLLEVVERDRNALDQAPGTVSEHGYGPAPLFVESLDDLSPARDLLSRPRRYYIGILDPCASIEFSRGCPWDCSFCSAWTFYGRSYRLVSPEVAVERVKQIREPGIFIVDDVAFIQEQHGLAIGEAIARQGIKKRYYLETRSDVLLRNREVFKFWKQIGLEYMFLGFEAIDAEGLERFRKRTTVNKNFEALELARSLGLFVSINLIVDPSWDLKRFKVVRDWVQEIPEVVNLSILTPYPGTETWYNETRRLTTRDYRLFDIQHAVLPTFLPLEEFYTELVRTQAVVYNKYLGIKGLGMVAPVVVNNLLHGSTNFLRMFMNFKDVFRPDLQIADHRRPVKYEMQLPPTPVEQVDPSLLYIHHAHGRRSRSLDEASEQFVDQTRMGGSA